MSDRLHWMPSTRSWLAKYKDEQGRHRSKRIPPEVLDEDEAWRWFAEFLKSRRDEVPAPTPAPPKLTVDELMQRWVNWLKDRPGAEKRTSSWKAGDAMLRLWVRPFPIARVLADELALEHCVDWIEDVCRKAKARNTARNVIKSMRNMLSDARGKGWRRGENLFLDPYVKRMIKQLLKPVRTDEVISLSLEQVRQLLAYQGRGVTPVRHTRNVVALATGLRRGEIIGLRVQDVCLDESPPVIVVERQVDTGESSRHDIVWKEPKAGSKRRVPIHPAVVPVLRRWLDGGLKQWTGKEPQPHDVLFPDPYGGPHVSNFAYEFRNDLAAYGLPSVFSNGKPFTFHALRRTCLTLLADADVPDGDIKAVAGHQQPGVTRKHYIAKNLQRIARGVAKVKLTAPAPRQRPRSRT